MKKVFYIIISLFSLLFFSCEIETSSNGKLDGNWQLQSCDTLSTGGICDMKRSGIYWAFENHLLQIRNIEKGEKILFRFERASNTLTIHSPHRFESRYETVPVEDVDQLIPFGIQGTEDTFQMEKLSGGILVLSNQQLRLHFRKY